MSNVEPYHYRQPAASPEDAVADAQTLSPIQGDPPLALNTTSPSMHSAPLAEDQGFPHKKPTVKNGEYAWGWFTW